MIQSKRQSSITEFINRIASDLNKVIFGSCKFDTLEDPRMTTPKKDSIILFVYRRGLVVKKD